MTGRYRTLLFDFDHTLFDTDAAERHAYDTSMAAAGVHDAAGHFGRYHEINQALWRAVERGEILPGDVRRTRFDRLIAELGLDIDIERLSDDFLVGMGEGGDWYPGAADLVDELTAAGYRVALVTNAISEVQRTRLDRIGGSARFDPIVISTEIGHAKPSSAFFDVAVERIGDADRESMLVIGDSLSSDVAGGNAAGIDTCWYNPRRRSNDTAITPTFEVGDYDDLRGVARYGRPDGLQP